MIRVMIVDDNQVIRRGIAALLAEADDIAVVGEASDGRRRSASPPRPTRRWCCWTCACR